jgi:hypothetical protein
MNDTKLLEWTALGGLLMLILYILLRPGGWDVAGIMVALGSAVGLVIGLLRR